MQLKTITEAYDHDIHVGSAWLNEYDVLQLM